eukprot:TRINITY_DN3747_c0_g1_i1.p1 TRINITY_DN3747_c0_g1~~TRINITY_DN3747_c0_g1_i1.p1  ORF type:complete len:365 (+),score=73.86 TRINITY_DN3747_c0_g1_i1:1194-2288(+)
MRVVLFLLLSIFVIANLAADNDIWEVTAHGAKKVDLSTINYFSQAGRVKRSAQSVLKTNSLTWQLVYEDVNLNTNVGFDDPVEGPKATAALEGVLNILGNALSGYTQTVNIIVKRSNQLNSGVAAQAGTYFSGATPGFVLGSFQTKVVTGVDTTSSSDGHGFISYTFRNIDWWYNTSIPTGVIYDFDFITVSLHELTHMLGFISLTNANGGSSIGTNVRSKFDELMVTGSNKALYDNSGKFIAANNVLTGKDSGLFLSVSGQKYPIYAPSTFQTGSSLSHWDPEKVYALMNPAVSPCMIIRGWSSAEIAVLQATGYDFSATAYAEPDTSNCINGFASLQPNSMASTSVASFATLISLLLLVIYA